MRAMLEVPYVHGVPAPLTMEVVHVGVQVGALSRALAVRTLQLEMEHVYGYLEEEALDIAQGSQAAGWLLFRQVQCNSTSAVTSCSPSPLPGHALSALRPWLWTAVASQRDHAAQLSRWKVLK